MRTQLSERALGRWRGILPALGIDPRHLTGKHGPCPKCGGKDRFRFDNKDGSGSWICTHCGAGYGANLVMLVHGLDFREAARKIEGVIGSAPIETFRRVRNEGKAALNDLYRASHPVREGDAVHRYLLARGLTARPPALRTVDRCRYQAEPPSWHPAMVAMVTAPDGRPCQLHRTYLGDGCKADVDQPRKLMPGLVIPGSAVRLTGPAEELGIAEGIETAMAATALYGVPCWAGLNKNGLAKWQPPGTTCRIVIFGDNDRSFAGQAAAYALAARLSSPERKVEVMIPDELETDWNDVLTRD
jgi:putative DNA primase/helicase